MPHSSSGALILAHSAELREGFRSAAGELGLSVELLSPLELTTRGPASVPAVAVVEIGDRDALSAALLEEIEVLLPRTALVLAAPREMAEVSVSSRLESRAAVVVRGPGNAREFTHALRQGLSARVELRAELPDASLSILLVEDDPRDIALIHAYLRSAFGGGLRLNHSVLLCNAVKAARVEAPDVVITDLSLPDAQGLDCIREMHRAAPDAALVVVSGRDEEDFAISAIQLGIQDYLTKNTLDATSLRRSIRYALERKAQERRLARLGYYDQLTGLGNRRLFRERLGSAFSRSRRGGGQIGLMILDLDRFKPINDSLGHDAGDSLLLEVASRLRHVVRGHDTVARLGGDEFGVVLDGLGPQAEQEAQRVAERMLARLEEPMGLAGEELSITGSLGIALCSAADEEVDFDDLCKGADTAMYAAKSRGGNSFEIVRGAHESEALPQLRSHNAVRHAHERREFVVYYQPVVDADTTQVVGHEALLRWRRADGSVGSPAEFLPVLEQTGDIVDVGAWVLEKACLRHRKWQEDSGAKGVIAVNVSGRQFGDANFLSQVENALLDSGLAAENLELEITETMLINDTARTRQTFEALKALGVRLALDDFGTGYSSLAHVAHFPVDTLKIDRSFVQEAAQVEAAATVVTAIIGLGHKLGLRVVAEGVETPEQQGRLLAEGCDFMQGYYFGKPAAKPVSRGRQAA